MTRRSSHHTFPWDVQGGGEAAQVVWEHGAGLPDLVNHAKELK